MAKTPKVTGKDRIGEPQDGASGGRIRRLAPVFIALVTLSAFAGGVWYAYDQGVKQGIRVTPPLIKAEPGPTKVVPENPGGLQVPNQDKQVFGRIASAPPDQKVEQLLPPQETPLPEEPEPVTAEPPAGAEADAPPSVPVESVQAEPIEPAEPVEQTAAAEPTEPEPETEPVQVPDQAGEVRIQLAAFREEAGARSGWDRLTDKFKTELTDLKPFIVRVDLGEGKGVFYRLQAGPLEDKQAAERLCAALKARKQSCLVVDTGN